MGKKSLEESENIKTTKEIYGHEILVEAQKTGIKYNPNRFDQKECGKSENYEQINTYTVTKNKLAASEIIQQL